MTASSGIGGARGDEGYAVALDAAGNAYVTGYFEGSASFGSTTLTSAGGAGGSRDVFVAKLDADGNWLWAERAGGVENDSGSGVAVDTAGNVYVSGDFYDTASFGGTTLTGNSSRDVFVAKLNSSGDWQWAKQAGGAANAAGYAVAVTSSGSPYVTGYFFGTASFGSTTLTSAGGQDVFVAKLDTNGNWLWAKRAGGEFNDSGLGIAVDAAGNAYATGYFQGTALFGSTTLTADGNAYDVFVAKLDANGNWLWAKRAGGTGWDSGYAVAVDTAGNTYVTGHFQGTASFGSTTLTSNGGTDMFVAKLDTNGNWLWAERAGGSGSDYGRGVAVDTSGNTYVTGEFSGTASFGSATLTSNGGTDVFVAKLSTVGNWGYGVPTLSGVPATVDVTVADSSGSYSTTVTLSVS